MTKLVITNQKGFASIVLIIALVVILAGGLGYFELTKKTDTLATATTTEQTATQQNQMVTNSSTKTSATIDKNSLATSSHNPIISGSAKNTERVYLTIVNEVGGLEVSWGGSSAAEVSFNRWSFDKLPYLPNGRYIVSIGDDGTNTSLITDTLVIGPSADTNAQLDNRCTQKAVGTGMCEAIFRAVEFNQMTKKCEYVSVGGCNFSSPFNETTYQDSDKELNLCRKVCEGVNI